MKSKSLSNARKLRKTATDAERTQWLESQGYKVIRFWNDAVFKEPESVVEVIAKALKER